MENTVEDFLDVDNQIPGQNYVLLSFISPNSAVEERELFTIKHFLASIYQKQKQRKEDEEKTDSTNKSQSGQSKEGYYKGLKPGYILPESFSEFLESYEDFKFTNEEKVLAEFNKINNNKTSIRGVKVRGVYDIIEHAKKKAKQLQSSDPNFNVFIGQVGYWLPWDPASKSHQIEDEVFANKQLNDLMQKYRENKTNRDLFYQELKEERIEYTKKNTNNDDDEKTLEDNEEESNSNFKEVVKNIF